MNGWVMILMLGVNMVSAHFDNKNACVNALKYFDDTYQNVQGVCVEDSAYSNQIIPKPEPAPEPEQTEETTQ